jgi:hypothetical protein
MIEFVLSVKSKNEGLFYFGLVCVTFAFSCLIIAKTTVVHVYGVNAWYKPFKFAFSTFLFSWSMAWYCSYLTKFNIQLFNWTVILLLGFEIVYIGLQAAKGQQSHFNVSTRFYATMFSMMAIAATIVSLYTAYVAILFCISTFTELPSHYVWSIRFALILFVVFSFQGFAMGSRMSHTVGAVNDNSSLFILGWSKLFGDLRVAHFIGMHALQVLPVLSFYVFKDTKWTVIFSVLYGVLAFSTLRQALKARPLISVFEKTNKEI